MFDVEFSCISSFRMNFFISKYSLIQLSCPKLNVKFGARTAYSMVAATGKI